MHQFKQGDRAIVLPTLDMPTYYPDNSSYWNRGHNLQVFTIATIEEVYQNVIECEGLTYYNGQKSLQYLRHDQLQPLPIPYSELDAE